MQNKMTRRQYLRLTAAAAAAAAAGILPLNAAEPKKKLIIPKRVLGRTGVEIPILTIGSGSLFQKAYRERDGSRDDEAAQLFHQAIDLGVTSFESGHNYGAGWPEKIMGRVLKTRRKEVFLTTKILGGTHDEIMRKLEISLKRLNTDHLDLLHVHWLKPGEEDSLGQKGRSVETYYKLREQKIVRFIGVSAHDDPLPITKFIERYDFDCVQVVLNAAMQGVTGDIGGWRLAPEFPPSFETITIPAAQKKNMGILAMKTLGYGNLLGEGPGKSDAKTLLRYAWSLPVSTAVVGVASPRELRQNAAAAAAFTPMPPKEMRELSSRLSPANKVALERFFATHNDC